MTIWRNIRNLLHRCALVLVAGAVTGCGTLPVLTLPEEETARAEVLLFADTSRIDELGRMAVPVMLNNTGPYHFLLDTGATHSVITRRVANQLGLSGEGHPEVALRGVNGLMRAPTTVVQSFQAGALSFNNLSMPILGGAVLGELDGILGMNTLSGVKVTADYDNQQIRISTTSGQTAGKHHTVVEFEHVSHRLILVDGRIGRTRVAIVVDTGGAQTLGNPVLLRALLRETGGQPGNFGTSQVLDATDNSQPALMARLSSIRMDAVAIRNLPVAFGAFPVFNSWGINDRPAMLLGSDALSLLGELTIDYQRKELHIVATAARQP